MNNLQTMPRPACERCGSEGMLVQTGVEDPDGVIPGTWSFRACSNEACGNVWLDPAPLPSELWKAYVSYHTHTKASAHKLARLAESFINRLTRLVFLPCWRVSGFAREAECLRYMTLKETPSGRLLDVGCGGGRFMRRMKRLGWEAEGIDFDEKATAKIARRYGLKTYTGDLLAAGLPEASYDAVTLNQSIEHLADPEKTLLECRRILKPGGRLVIVTPNVEARGVEMFGPFWRGWEPPRHLHLFAVRSLERLLQKCGFDVRVARTSAAGSAIIYRVSAVNRRKTQGPVPLVARLGFVIWSYRMELQEFSAQKAGYHAGQNVLACAVKPAGPQ